MENCIGELVKYLKDEIERNEFTCMVWQDDVCFAHDSRGVKPVADFWSKGFLDNAVVVDKVIGRASAMFMADAGVKYAHGNVISGLAADIFEKAGIFFSYDKMVPKIVNRSGDGLCPMESAVANVSDSKEGIDILLGKVML